MYSKEVAIPEGVNVEISKMKFTVSGPKGSVEKKFELTKEIKVEKAENKIKISSENERRNTKALIGTNIGHMKNAIEGVTKGFIYRLRVVYSHFPVTVKAEKDKVVISNFLGERTNRIAKIIGQTQVKIEGADIIVNGINIEDVGQTASNLELACRIVGFDRKIYQDGIYIVSKGEEK
jgi:large subunit ribosomal protein L6